MKLETLTISPNKTVKEALKQLDQGGEKILFVVDEEQRITGTLTDGDIRRYILRGGNLQDAIDGCFNREPTCLKQGYDLKTAKEIMVKTKKEVLPVIDKDRKLVGMVAWNQVLDGSILQKEKIDIPVVIMAGGKGTRMDPFTKIMPKPLIPIGEKPIVEIIMDRFNEYGIKEFYLTINYKGDMIKSYFNNADIGYSINYVQEEEFLGTAGSLRLLPDDFGQTFIVSNCDIIIEANYADLVSFHRRKEHCLTIVGSIQHYRIPYGIIEHEEGGAITDITEKPEYDLLVNTGMYVLDKKAIQYIPEEKKFHMTDLIKRLLKDGCAVGVYPVSEKSYVDIGQWEEYRKNMERFITE
jgi:dTDP-glucose pyrophosphorylase